MKETIKGLLCIGLVILGAVLFDKTDYKLTGVIVIIFGVILGVYEEKKS